MGNETEATKVERVNGIMGARNFSDIFKEGVRLAKEDLVAAKEYFKKYVGALEDGAGISRGEAERCARSNFGYYAGYYGEDVSRLVAGAFGAEHPFGLR